MNKRSISRILLHISIPCTLPTLRSTALATHAAGRHPSRHDRKIVSDRLILNATGDLSPVELRAKIRRAAAANRIRRHLNQRGNRLTLAVPDGREGEIARKPREDPDFELVTPGEWVEPAVTTGNPHPPAAWHPARIHTNTARTTSNGAGVTVAGCDTWVASLSDAPGNQEVSHKESLIYGTLDDDGRGAEGHRDRARVTGPRTGGPPRATPGRIRTNARCFFLYLPH